MESLVFLKGTPVSIELRLNVSWDESNYSGLRSTLSEDFGL